MDDDANNNLEQQADERLAMQAIYPVPTHLEDINDNDDTDDHDHAHDHDHLSPLFLVHETTRDTPGLYRFAFTCSDLGLPEDTRVDRDSRTILATLAVRTPFEYPGKAAPTVDLFIVDEAKTRGPIGEDIAREARAMWTPETVVVFDIVEMVRERLREVFSEHANLVNSKEQVNAGEKQFDVIDNHGPIDSDKNDDSDSDDYEDYRATTVGTAALSLTAQPPATTTPSTTQSLNLTIAHSPTPLTEKKSVFIAHCCRVQSAEDIGRFREQLFREQPRLATATHNIMAYRFGVPIIRRQLISSTSSSARNGGADMLIHADYNDDGETAAGGRLLRMLTLADCMDVVVVVSRWFGGVQLGPRRFKLINQCARDLLESEGYIGGGTGTGSGTGVDGDERSTMSKRKSGNKR